MTIAAGQPMLASDINDLTFFPKGTILTFSSEAWNSTSASFKNVWKICNGQNGTPNLVNKFLRGGESSGATGDGQKTLSVNEIPAHEHSITDPGHKHAVALHTTIGAAGYNGDALIRPAKQYTDSAVTGITVNKTGGGASFEVVPAYYQVIYIMKVL
jgi:hypothetical protein